MHPLSASKIIQISRVNTPCPPEQPPEYLEAASDTPLQKNLRWLKTTLDRPDWEYHLTGTSLKSVPVVELGSAAEAVLSCVSDLHYQLNPQEQSHKKIVALIKSMARVINHIQPVNDNFELNQLKKTLEVLPELIYETVNFVETWLEQPESLFVNNSLTSSDKDKTDELETRHRMFEKEFDRVLKIDEAGQTNSLSEQDLNELRDRLVGGWKPVEPRAHKCIPGTRVSILTDVVAKTDDRDGVNILWIRGAPGSGKSSLSLTTKSRLEEEKRLVTYFRFDRNESSTTTAVALWRRVAYDLACLLPSLRSQLLQQLRDDTLALDSPMDIFTSLIEGPLLKLTDSPGDHPNSLLIVIDALDECGGFVGRLSPDRQYLLQTLARWCRLPKHFKLIVTSREEVDISEVLSSISAPINMPSGSSLVDNPASEALIEAAKDIYVLLIHRFQDIREKFSLPTDWPGTKKIDEMAHRAAGIFMWAITAANFIESESPNERLKRILEQIPGSLAMKPLYSLYYIILETSFGKFTDSSPEAEALRAVLGTIVFSRRPLHDDDYAKLPTKGPVGPAMVRLIRESLHSVLDRRQTLRFVHKSFDDFLLSEECPPKYQIEMEESHYLLTKLCVLSMTELRFNVCDLETSCLKNADVPDIEARVIKSIPAILSYSCCFWAEHLELAPFDKELMVAVKEMMMDKLLYWFEAMSLMKETNRVLQALPLVLAWVHASPDEDFKGFVNDARQFLTTFIQPIQQSAPHIYISALPFSPGHLSVANHFLSRFPNLLTLTTGKLTNWSLRTFTSRFHRDYITSIAFSPDEKYFVSGSTDGNICICDSVTGNLLSGPLKTDGVVSHIFFDPDGRRVWATLFEETVIGWDIETGDQQHTYRLPPIIGCCRLNGSQALVSVEWGTITLWSPDTGERLHDLPFEQNSYMVALSANDCYIACTESNYPTVRIWRLVDGSEIRLVQISSPGQRQFHHTEDISALSFAIDGNYAVSGSKDGTILVWDARTGDPVGPPLDSGMGMVGAVAYSHADRLLVSVSHDGTTIVWNASTRKAVLEPLDGLTSWVTLSRDGQRALTAAYDGTVKMRSLEREADVDETHADEGHKDEVQDVNFSSSGGKLASISFDGMIRVWDTDNEKPPRSPIDSLSDYGKIKFSPDGSQIMAYDSHDGTLQVWNADTGKPDFRQALGDKQQSCTRFLHLSFRPVDQLFVSCSNDGIVCIRNLKDGTLRDDPSISSPRPVNTRVDTGRYLEIITPSISTRVDTRRHFEIIALSPDGSNAIVRDAMRDPRHYVWRTTDYQPLPISFADEDSLRYRVAYSPNGKFVVATTFDDTGDVTQLRVWNAETGEVVAGPVTLIRKISRLAFSPDDRHIAFSYSSDSTAIWVWDTRKKQLVSGPWNGHTSDITALTFSPDGDKLASGSHDGQIRIWDADNLLGDSKMSSVAPEKWTRMDSGWVIGENGELLFWVPVNHRERLDWPGNLEVFGGSGIKTKLDLSKFKYGEHWVECFSGEKVAGDSADISA